MPNVSNFGTQTDNAVVQGTVTDRAMVIPDVPPSGLESVGPRVTPHFVKPSLWSALTTYHFFDAVHDAAGASYVAIKPEVPAGTELTDEGYWFLWADPNSQFADLSELVKTFNGRIAQNTAEINAEVERATEAEKTKAPINHASEETIYGIGNASNYGHVKLATNDTPATSDANEGVAVTPAYIADILEKPKAIIIGDSYSTPYTNSPWWKFLCNALGVEPHCYAVGGAGFAVLDNLFSTQAQKAASDALKNVQYIFVYGGVNDMAHSNSASNVKDGCDRVLQPLKTAYGKAKTYVMGVNTWKTFYTRETNTTKEICNALHTSAGENGAFYINTMFACFGNDAWFFAPGESNQNHPNRIGQKIIYEAIANAITGNGITQKLINKFTKDELTFYVYRPTFDKLIISYNLSSITNKTYETDICGYAPQQYIQSVSNSGAPFTAFQDTSVNKMTLRVFAKSATGESNNFIGEIFTY